MGPKGISEKGEINIKISSSQNGEDFSKPIGKLPNSVSEASNPIQMLSSNNNDGQILTSIKQLLETDKKFLEQQNQNALSTQNKNFVFLTILLSLSLCIFITLVLTLRKKYNKMKQDVDFKEKYDKLVRIAEGKISKGKNKFTKKCNSVNNKNGIDTRYQFDGLDDTQGLLDDQTEEELLNDDHGGQIDILSNEFEQSVNSNLNGIAVNGGNSSQNSSEVGKSSSKGSLDNKDSDKALIV